MSESDVLTFTLLGRFKPYTRMTQRSKWADRRAKEYLNSQLGLKWQFHTQMSDKGYTMLSGQTPLGIRITISPNHHNRDLSNLLKAIEDSAQGIIYPDDRWIDQIEAVRKPGDEDVTMVEVWELAPC